MLAALKPVGYNGHRVNMSARNAAQAEPLVWEGRACAPWRGRQYRMAVAVADLNRTPEVLAAVIEACFNATLRRRLVVWQEATDDPNHAWLFHRTRVWIRVMCSCRNAGSTYSSYPPKKT